MAKRSGTAAKPADLPGPVLPGHREALYEIRWDELLLDGEGDGVRIEGGDSDGRPCTRLVLRTAWLRGVQSPGLNCSGLRITDVRWERCDLSNAQLRGMEALRAEWLECRMLGLAAPECRWDRVRITGGEARYARFPDATWTNCLLSGCDLREVDLRGANLRGTAFPGCDLTGADLRGANLDGADLRGAQIEGVEWHAEDVRGAIVSADQALAMAPLLGIRIE